MEMLDRYRIVSPLGAGGMGEVFLADDTRLERRVAIKLLPPDSEHDTVARERRRQQALAAAAVDHRFIWHGRMLVEAAGGRDRSRGLAMVEATLAAFRGSGSCCTPIWPRNSCDRRGCGSAG